MTAFLAQVAEWHGHIDPDLFGFELYKLGRFYNTAFLGVESNNHGLTTLTTLINGHALHKTESYRNLYFKELIDEENQRRTKKFGWKTDLKAAMEKGVVPEEFKDYVHLIEYITHARVSIQSYGPKRNETKIIVDERKAA